MAAAPGVAGIVSLCRWPWVTWDLSYADSLTQASSRDSSPEMSFTEVRKSRTGRKSHSSSRSSGQRRSSTYDYGGGFSTVVEEDDSIATASSSGGHSSRSSRKSTYDTSVDYVTTKSKTSGGGKKGHRHRSQY
ncbi:hypothetical protein F5Y10DRAFT_223338 [Nemania abortiva]|nr:hypothetical protein F5Y10DRAFT_223338 [Nemania abortiva]